MRTCMIFLLSVLICACTSYPSVYSDSKNATEFKVPERTDKVAFPDPAILAEFEADAEPVYRLGEGDQLMLSVWGRPELTGKTVIGPDGQMSMFLIGSQKLSGLTREEAQQKLTKALEKFYKKPVLSLAVEQYQNNRVTILGRVQNPGTIVFDRPPTILEVLAKAGSLPVIDKQATLTRCAVFRGREKVIWVDLQRLLTRSDPTYNIRLKPNDLVYIPDSNDTSVYVLGSVLRPGAYRLTPDMSLLDALSQAGGPNEDANLEEIGIYRASRKAIERIPFKSLLTADRRLNFSMEEGDIIYVPKSGVAQIGYTLRQLLPGMSLINFTSSGSSTGTK
ncbi:SLBB domain-containing protein [Undibacterium squillarum]|uniref:Polysaccharide export outer membrane protein n=1 Tax=Undibacterium squillarum TaxID=1131567 RepID=A0ABQ2XVP8_9BURK|nr:polysaccharide biosynthesis/export family protein [Undibacterium squillarum]GGX36522.1 hypothetical protein GCM10010946_12920 [Undibacterium squillarum]